MLESFSFKETLTCFMVLFAVIDILGSVPIIVSLRKQFGHIDAEFLRRKNRRCYANDFQKSFWNYPFSDFY